MGISPPLRRPLRQRRGQEPEPRATGPRVFSASSRNTRVPSRFRQPPKLIKYAGETDLSLWVDDYRLACRNGGARDDDFTTSNLPLFLADSTRTWLEHLTANRIHNWGDMKEIFVGNFQGTYERPRNHGTSRTAGRSQARLREYIRPFSKDCNAVPNVVDAASGHSFQAPLASPWFTSSAARAHGPPRSSWTSQPSMPPTRRRWGRSSTEPAPGRSRGTRLLMRAPRTAQQEE